ncbi:hypothetical protein A8709_32445 [Paenibacillus pectinilyticus]|uniref:Uncharacterized protein n=1 Tax=Paenibacillus pectinilyticus TaxID=512399 RepID=A0A1C0ZWP1_9BACL|nr:hypothetical protein [Paenibacillus pectinilyticus]OCT12533.1 hypothetical protein A8709_32445 [Paenibacillus pectinilyticus]
MNLQSYLNQHEPQRLTGEELTEIRKATLEMLKSGNETAVLVAIGMKKLLNHIDQITLEGMRKK